MAIAAVRDPAAVLEAAVQGQVVTSAAAARLPAAVLAIAAARAPAAVLEAATVRLQVAVLAVLPAVVHHPAAAQAAHIVEVAPVVVADMSEAVDKNA